jgi:hypothetical protein
MGLEMRLSIAIQRRGEHQNWRASWMMIERKYLLLQADKPMCSSTASTRVDRLHFRLDAQVCMCRSNV